MDSIKNQYLADLVARRIRDGQDHFTLLARLRIWKANGWEEHILALRGTEIFYIQRSESDLEVVEVEDGGPVELASKLDRLGVKATTAREPRVELDLSEDLLAIAEDQDSVAGKVAFLRERADVTTAGESLP